MESEIARLPLHGADEQFSIAFMFSPIYLRLEDVLPLPLGSEMNQVSEVNECISQSTPPLPAPDVMPEKESCEFQINI